MARPLVYDQQAQIRMTSKMKVAIKKVAKKRRITAMTLMRNAILYELAKSENLKGFTPEWQRQIEGLLQEELTHVAGQLQVVKGRRAV